MDHIFLLILALLLFCVCVFIFLKYKYLQKLFQQKDKEISDKVEEISAQATQLEMQNRLTEAYAMDLEASRFELTAALDKLDKAHQTLQRFSLNLQLEVNKRTEALKKQNTKILQFAFINAHKTRAPLARVMGLINLIQYAGKEIIDDEVMDLLFNSSKELDHVLSEAQDLLIEAEYEEKKHENSNQSMSK